MDHRSTLEAILSGDPRRWHILESVRALALPDCWVGAGFVRNPVWDYLHGRSPSHQSGDVDVLWFDPASTDPLEDRKLEAGLTALDSSVDWSVKNQARMHVRNGDAPYGSTVDAMRYWPETATAVAVRRTEDDRCEIAAPFGLDDLFGLILKPTPRFAGEKRQIFTWRVETKGWLEAWPLLRLLGD